MFTHGGADRGTSARRGLTRLDRIQGTDPPIQPGAELDAAKSLPRRQRVRCSSVFYNVRLFLPIAFRHAHGKGNKALPLAVDGYGLGSTI